MQRPNKVNILEGDWLGKSYQAVLPHFTEAGLLCLKETTLPLTRLHDESYWGNLRAIHRIFLAKLDYRHWYYDDDVFEEYAKRVASLEFPAICFSENPFGYERPRQADIDVFQKKLFERTKYFTGLIRNLHPETKIVSPAISLVDLEVRDTYLAYFLHNRSLFDVYSLHCCYDMQEQSTAMLTGFLNEVLNILRKNVWVTRWAMPSSEESILNPFALGQSVWRAPNAKEAAMKMKHVFSTIESITKQQSCWFFTGAGQDEYHPARRIEQPLWQKNPHIVTSVFSPTWDYRHFTGLMNYKNEIKEPILDALVSLATSDNA